MGILALAAAARAQSTTTFAGLTPVGTTSQAAAITVTAVATGSIASITALTSGAPNLDFTVAGGGTCAANLSLSPGQTCTVEILFRPRYPGVRQGAVLLQAAGGGLLGSAPLSGIGQGGLPVLIPGQINTVAGDGQWVYHGDGVPATEAPIFLPTGLAVDGRGNLFLADSSNNRVRRVDASSGSISTIAGTGTAGGSGDGGLAVNAELNNPSGLALDGGGNLYIADSGDNTVRRVDAITGVITTVAGTPGVSGYTGDGQLGPSGKLTNPQGLALTAAGDLVIADTGNAAVRVLTMATGILGTVAGTGTAGYNGDGIAATSAQLNNPWGVAVRADGAIAIADLSNHRVRLVSTSGVISTVVGTGARGFSGDNDPATQAELNGPAAVAFDPAGDLLVADSGNNRVRGVYGSPGIIVTLTGNSSEEFSGDGGPDNQAGLYGPYALVFDPQGNIWVSDMFHNRVREISGSVLGITYPTMRVGKTSAPIPEAMYNGGNGTLTLSSPVLDQAALGVVTPPCGGSPLAPMDFCNMALEFAPTQVGQNITGSVSWPSDAPNVTPVDSLSGQVLSVEPTSVAIIADANPGLLGGPVTLTATVTSADTGRTGTVTFVEGGSIWCSTVALSNAGTASCTIQSLSLGTHTFTANYSGDNNNAASASPAYTEVIKQQPALALAVSTSPAVITSNVTLTLTAADQTGVPTGTVVFYDGTTALATVALNGAGLATWSTQTLSVGAHLLSAQYSGDTSNVAAASNAVTEQIAQANTLTVLGSSDTSPTVGAAVTLHATVVSNNGPAPTGSVTFKDGEALLGSAALDGNGAASITVSTLTPGPHSLFGIYSGDTDDAPSSSGALAAAVQQIATVTTLGADANPLNAGATLHLTAIVALAPGASTDGTLAGTITFRDGAGSGAPLLGTAVMNSTGQATLAVPTLAVGSHSIVASFGGETNYAASNSAPLSEAVQKSATQVTLSSASATTLMSKPATFTATVSSATGVPTGTVSFHDGATTLGSAPVNTDGNATYVITTLSQGTHSITAVYSGDASYLATSSAALQQTVQLAQPALTLSGPGGPADAGTSVQMVAVLTTPGAPPAGTLTLLDGTTPIAMQTLTNGGSFTFSSRQLAIGVHTLTASYSGDFNTSAAVSAAITVTVRQANSTTALVASANPLTQGGALTLTATVFSDSPNPAGQVTFYDGTTLLGTVPLAANGFASLSPLAFTLGVHSLTAVYGGDTNHGSSTAPPVSELVLQSSFATLTSSANPSPSGQNVTFSAQIHAGSTAFATGTATFRDNGALLATLPLDGSGLASLGTATLSVGTHTITVTYSGDTNFAATTAQLVQTVINASTQVTLVSGANPATYGQPLSLSANVTSNGGAATGAVDFTDGGTTIGSAQLNTGGVAVLTLATLSPGAHAIVANYVGDGKASPSVSVPFALAVKQTTELVLNSDVNPAQTLSPVTLRSTLTNAGAAPATGSVGFADGGVALGTATLDSSGHASLTVPQMSAGIHAITVAYAGDGANFASTSPVFNETIDLRPTTTTVTSSSTDPANPQQMTLIAVVKGQGSMPPGGLVTFASGAVILGAAAVDATGVATITVIFETTTLPVIASYAGDASYQVSSSGATPITAGQAAQFTLTVNAASISLASHQHTTVNVTLSSVQGFTDTVALGCMGLPFAATCTFDSSQLKLAANGTATASLILDTGDPLGAGSGTSASLSSRGGVWFSCLPAGLLLGFVRRGNRGRMGRVLAVACAIALSLGGVGITGCAGLSTSGTPPGTYTFKVVGTGQGSGTTEAQIVTLVVTQ